MEMNGTEKQIAWAKRIIDNALNNNFNGLLRTKNEMETHMSNRQAKIDSGRWSGEQLEKRVSNMKIKKDELNDLCEFIDFIQSCDDAAFIIDNRNIFTSIYPHQMATQIEKWNK
jgi:hypothetical protein